MAASRLQAMREAREAVALALRDVEAPALDPPHAVAAWGVEDSPEGGHHVIAPLDDMLAQARLRCAQLAPTWGRFRATVGAHGYQELLGQHYGPPSAVDSTVGLLGLLLERADASGSWFAAAESVVDSPPFEHAAAENRIRPGSLAVIVREPLSAALFRAGTLRFEGYPTYEFEVDPSAAAGDVGAKVHHWLQRLIRGRSADVVADDAPLSPDALLRSPHLPALTTWAPPSVAQLARDLHGRASSRLPAVGSARLHRALEADGFHCVRAGDTLVRLATGLIGLAPSAISAADVAACYHVNLLKEEAAELLRLIERSGLPITADNRRFLATIADPGTQSDAH